MGKFSLPQVESPAVAARLFLGGNADEYIDACNSTISFARKLRADGSVDVASFIGRSVIPKHHFHFRTIDRAARWIDGEIAAQQSRIDNRAARADLRKIQAQAFVMPFQVGDTLEGSWGYDQTNVEFYEVVKVVSAVTVDIRALRQQIVKDCGPLSMAEYVVPATGDARFWPDVGPEVRRDSYAAEKARVLRKRVSPRGDVNLTDYCRLRKWDFEPCYQSHYA